MGKSGPNATFKTYFSWVGLALGWGIRRFHNNIYSEYMFSNPTEFGKSQTPYSAFSFRGVFYESSTVTCSISDHWLKLMYIHTCCLTLVSLLLSSFIWTLCKLWSQVSSLLPPGTCLQFLSGIRLSIPTTYCARRFSSNVANSLSCAFRYNSNKSICAQEVPKNLYDRRVHNMHSGGLELT